MALVVLLGSRRAAVWGGRGVIARLREAERSSGRFRRFSFCGVFYLEFSVGEAISLNFGSFSILTKVLDIFLLTFFSIFWKKNILILAWILYVEISVGVFVVLKLV